MILLGGRTRRGRRRASASRSARPPIRPVHRRRSPHLRLGSARALRPLPAAPASRTTRRLEAERAALRGARRPATRARLALRRRRRCSGRWSGSRRTCCIRAWCRMPATRCSRRGGIARLRAPARRTDPRHLFDGNIFYPLPLTLDLLGRDVPRRDCSARRSSWPASIRCSSSNVLTLLAFPPCGLAFFYAGWRLTGDPRAALRRRRARRAGIRSMPSTTAISSCTG